MVRQHYRHGGTCQHDSEVTHKKPEEKHELETVYAVCSVESSARTKDISQNLIHHAKASERAYEEPYVGKSQVRFREGFHNFVNLI